MKLVVIAGGALVASILGGCAGTSRSTADPDRAAKQAEADKAAAQEGARKAQNDAAREQAEAQEAKRAQHAAEQQAQWATERAALAEAQAAHEAKPPTGSTTRVAGTTERQADTARAIDTTRAADRTADTNAAIPSKVDVLFNANSTELSADAKAKLDPLAQSLKVQPQAHDVLVEGFTDDAGPESTNVQLSEKRAEAVVEYLASRGVPRDRLASKSLGSEHAVNHDGTDRGRALNRRVEILIRPAAKR